MEDTAYRAIAIVGVGAILPDAPNVAAFWDNIKKGRYSISEVAPERWDPALYYDSDHGAPDKTYSKIGGWVRDYEWDPLKWRLGPAEVAPGDSAARRRCHGRRTEVGDCLHARSAGRLRLPPAAAGPRTHGGDPGQRHGGGKALFHLPAHLLSGVRARTGRKRHFRRAAGGGAQRHHARIPQPHRPASSRNHRRHHARRAGQRNRRPHCQHVQLPRPQFRDRRRLRIGHGGDQRGGRGAGAEQLRCGHHRRHRPQYGRYVVRQVLQDRRALGDRHASLRGGSRRLRDGRRRGHPHAEAAGRCRA
ncbi:hypothetical protein SBA4_5570002 [Candidatus Sulfopaludibacter sp. SbA4]|nr:hypothetical protein SBA4_5570002 [Candidatus Sulfopaludibacter sp. SbA4]